MRSPHPSACFYFQVKVWDCNTGKCIETLKVRPVGVAPKGVVKGLPGEAGGRQDMHPQSLVKCFWQGVLDVAHACAFTPDGKLLVSGAADQARREVHRSIKPPRASRI